MKRVISIAVLLVFSTVAIESASAKSGASNGTNHNSHSQKQTLSLPKFTGGSLVAKTLNGISQNNHCDKDHCGKDHCDKDHDKNPPGVIVDPVHPAGSSQPVISDPITIVGAGTGKGFHSQLDTIKPITNTAVLTGGTTTGGASPSRPDYIWVGDHWQRNTSGQIYTSIDVRDHRGEGNPDRGGGITVGPVKPRTEDVIGTGGSPIDDVINYFAEGFPHGSLDPSGTRDHRTPGVGPSHNHN